MENSNQNLSVNDPNNQPVIPTVISPDTAPSNNLITTPPNPQPVQSVTPQGGVIQPQPIVSGTQPFNVGLTPPKNKMNKKLFIVVGVILVLIVGGGALAYTLLKKKPTTTATKVNSSSSSTTSTSSSGNASSGSGSSTKANYTSSSGGFSAWFPATPDETQGSSQLNLPDNTELTSGSSWVYAANSSSGIPQYEIDEYAMPSGDNFTASQIADASVKSTLLIPGSKAISNSPSKVGVVPAETFAVFTPASSATESPDTYTYSIIVVNHDNIYFIGMATTQQNDPNATKFLSSFSFN